VGVGAVVAKDVGDYALMFGNPARECMLDVRVWHQIDFQSDIIACPERAKQYSQTRKDVRGLENRRVMQQAGDGV